MVPLPIAAVSGAGGGNVVEVQGSVWPLTVHYFKCNMRVKRDSGKQEVNAGLVDDFGVCC